MSGVTHPKQTGLFIVLEGGEGSGKTTQAKLIAERLRAAPIDREVVLTAEPGSTPLGERIREMVLSSHAGPMDPHAETALYLADRADHVSRVIRPALDRGAIVICDRYTDSTIVYQGCGRQLGAANLEQMCRWATQSTEPDLVLVLDIDPAEGLARAADRSTPDRFEQENIDFHTRVRQGYVDRVAANVIRRTTDPAWPHTAPLYVLIDAFYDVETVAHQIGKYVNTLVAASAAKALR